MPYVYIHKKVVNNEVFYVGIGTRPFKRAYIKHQRSALWKRITAKYEYVVEVTHTDILWEEAQSIERYLIAFYGRIDNNTGTLANHTDGGEGCFGLVITDEWRRKNSEIKKGKKFSEQHRKRISEAKKGKPLFGANLERAIKQLNENRQKGVDAAKTPIAIAKRIKSYKENYIVSDETKRKMSALRKGKPLSEQHKKRLSVSLMGRIVSQEVREAHSKKLKGKFINGLNPNAKKIIDNETGIVYDSIKESGVPYAKIKNNNKYSFI